MEKYYLIYYVSIFLIEFMLFYAPLYVLVYEIFHVDKKISDKKLVWALIFSAIIFCVISFPFFIRVIGNFIN